MIDSTVPSPNQGVSKKYGTYGVQLQLSKTYRKKWRDHRINLRAVNLSVVLHNNYVFKYRQSFNKILLFF